ncbi:MAG TPA: sugar transferase [Clostridiaceae bacterium]|nr:sugar transferase [Clostridiaceae bacterium]
MEVLDRKKIITQDVMLENVKKLDKTFNYKNVYGVIKRSLDVTLSVIALIILSPIFLIIAAIIKLDSKGPVFFIHKRIGKNGKEIGIYKFRSMVQNAEDMIAEFTEEQKKEFRENYKLQYDPRVTKIGKFLRKTSLDELPQILNILKGDLSIIGPRPVIKRELEKYENNKEKFLSVKPGLTGFWAANGRSDTTYSERVQMELYYIDHMSLKMDIKIFFKTIISVIKKEGAR